MHALSTICSIDNWLASRMIVCGRTVGSIAPVSTSPERKRGAWALRYAGQTILSCAGRGRAGGVSGRASEVRWQGERGVPSTLADPASVEYVSARRRKGCSGLEEQRQLTVQCVPSGSDSAKRQRARPTSSQLCQRTRPRCASIVRNGTDLLCAVERRGGISDGVPRHSVVGGFARARLT